MRRSLSVRIATLLLVASMATPMFAARRDDSEIGPFARFERVISHFVQHVIHICDDSQISPPK